MPRFAAALALSAFAALCALPAGAAEKSAFTDAQKAEIKKMVREYILENPGIINEAIQAQEVAADKAKSDKRVAIANTRKQEIYTPSENTVLGNPKGDVTVVEFFDYNCGYCKAMFPSVVEAMKEDPKLRLVVKEFPILGPSSVTATRAALAARKQNKYTELHLALMSHKGSLTDAGIIDIAKSTGLDVKKLQDDMKDPEITAVITRNHDLAEQLGIDGTPAMFVGNNFVAGAIPKTQLVSLIAAARKP